MHRSYQPLTPATNTLLRKRWDETTHEIHRRKVIHARSTIENGSPKTYPHLHMKLKKKRMEEENMLDVARHNEMLRKKIQVIKNKHDTTTIDTHAHNKLRFETLNERRRIANLLRLEKENQALLKRFRSAPSCLKRSEWERGWQTNQQYSTNISTYPRRQALGGACADQVTTFPRLQRNLSFSRHVYGNNMIGGEQGDETLRNLYQRYEYEA